MPHFPEVGRVPLQPKWIFSKFSFYFPFSVASSLTPTHSYFHVRCLKSHLENSKVDRRMDSQEPNAGDNRHQSATAPKYPPSLLLPPAASLQSTTSAGSSSEPKYAQCIEVFSTCHVKPTGNPG